MMFDIIALQRCYAALAVTILSLKSKLAYGLDTTEALARVHEAIDALNAAAGREPHNVVRVDFARRTRPTNGSGDAA